MLNEFNLTADYVFDELSNRKFIFCCCWDFTKLYYNDGLLDCFSPTYINLELHTSNTVLLFVDATFLIFSGALTKCLFVL